LRLKHHATLQEQHGVEEQLATLAGPGGEKTKQELHELQAESGRLEERINYCQDSIKDLNGQRQALESEKRKVEKELRDLEAQGERLAKEAKEKAAAHEKAEKELKSLRDL